MLLEWSTYRLQVVNIPDITWEFTAESRNRFRNESLSLN